MLIKLLGYTASVAVGLALKVYFFPHLFGSGWAVAAKLTDNGRACSWERTLTYYSRLDRFDQRYREVEARLKITGYDAEFDIDQVALPGARTLWLPRYAAGPSHAWLLAEHDWMEANNSEDHVQPGDIVIEAGAGAGVFVAKALRRGASKIVAIEPDPRLLECLRRNFRHEIAFGRVVVAPVNAVTEEASIDRLVHDLRIARVHFLRIATAREALKGAMRILRQDRPRVMLDLNHRPDDVIEVPRILRSAYEGYRASCGPCRGDSPEGHAVVPHVTFFR